MPDTPSPVPLSAAERHCLRHYGHVVARGREGKLTATIVGGDAGGIILREGASSGELKVVFANYDLRLEVSP